MPPTTAQRIALRTYALVCRGMTLDLAVTRTGQRPPNLDALLLDVRQLRGELGIALDAERARRRFLARR